MENQCQDMQQIEMENGCHVTLQFAQKPNPDVRKEIAAMFIALLEGRDITQAEK